MRKPNAKERILETAGVLFHQRGYSEVGINEIIAKAETAKASFYQHYPSKQALCEAWLSSIHDKSEERLEALLSKDCSEEEKLAEYFDFLHDYMVSSDFRGCPYSNTSTVSGGEGCGIREQILIHKESMRVFFRDLCFLKCKDRQKAEAAGDQIFILYSGAAAEAQNLLDVWPILAAKDAALRILSE